MTGLPDAAPAPGRSADPRPFPDVDYAHAVVVAAHPRDAILALSGVLQHLHARDTAIALVVATDSEAEHTELGRRSELRDALDMLGLSRVDIRWLGLPDGDLAAHRTELAERLTELLTDADVCLVPWPGGPHPDHRTVADIALAAAPVTTHRWSYLIGPWSETLDMPRSQVFAYRMDARQRQRKTAGAAAFTTRHHDADPIPASWCSRDTEIVLRQPPTSSAPISRFAELYDEDADPWSVATRWYERRKRALVLASLPRERYTSAVEPACGTGVLTRALADRCDRVLAFDPVPAAVQRCQARTADLPHVSVVAGALPADLPSEPADLIVFSEILYYLDDADLTATVDTAVAALRPGGHLVAVHWLPWAAEAPRDGIAAHRVLLADPGLDRVVEHLDERFVLHVLARR